MIQILFYFRLSVCLCLSVSCLSFFRSFFPFFEESDMILMFFSSTAIPSIHNQPQSIYVKPGQNALFPCNYTGFPTPTVHWSVFIANGINTTVDQKAPGGFPSLGDQNNVFYHTLTVSPDGSLLFTQVLQTFNGSQFQCTVTNSLKKDVGSLVNLIVVNSKFCYTCKHIVFARSRVNTLKCWVARWRNGRVCCRTLLLCQLTGLWTHSQVINAM